MVVTELYPSGDNNDDDTTCETLRMNPVMKVDPVQPRWSLSSVSEFRRIPPLIAILAVADPVPFYLYLECLYLHSIYI